MRPDELEPVRVDEWGELSDARGPSLPPMRPNIVCHFSQFIGGATGIKVRSLIGRMHKNCTFC